MMHGHLVSSFMPKDKNTGKFYPSQIQQRWLRQTQQNYVNGKRWRSPKYASQLGQMQYAVRGCKSAYEVWQQFKNNYYALIDVIKVMDLKRKLTRIELDQNKYMNFIP